MDIKTAENKFQHVSYNSSEWDNLKDHLTETIERDGHHLSLFLGLYEPNKKKALQQFSSTLNREVEIINTRDLASSVESVSYEKIDQFFEGNHPSDVIMYFKNGDKLCGPYSSFSQSRVKYATPQERYFLKKVQNFNGLVIVDVDEFNDADSTLRRAAQSVVSFTLPDSKWTRFWWHVKNYSPHGYDLKTKRPDAYGENSLTR